MKRPHIPIFKNGRQKPAKFFSSLSPSVRFVSVWDRLALLCLFLAFAVMGYVMFNIVAHPRDLLPEIAGQEDVPPVSEGASLFPVAPSFESYSVLNGRNLFQSEQMVGPESGSGEPVASPSTALWGQEYKLVGVLLDREPRAVVENRNTPGSQFLAVGDRLGEAVLEKIEEAGVTFRYQGQAVQLLFQPGANP